MKFSTPLKKTLFIICCIATTHKTYAQEYNDYIPTSLPNYSEMTNVNSSLVKGRFQDIKRGVIQFWTENPRLLKSTGILINTVDNNDKKAYILTSQHYLESSVGDVFDIWLSFDYELPNEVTPDDYQDSHQAFHIERLYKTPVKILVSEINSDITLLEVDFSDIPLSIHTAFTNSFAVGWNLHPDYKNQGFHVISHPRFAPKKIVYDYNSYISLSGTRDPRQNSAIPPRKFIGLSQNSFAPNSGDQLAIGCCGGSLLDKNGLSFAVSKSHGGTAWFSLLENVWINNYDNAGINTLGIMHYLDPGSTWISSIPGGYLKDLISNPVDVNYDLEVTNAPKTKTINLNARSLFYGLKNTTSIVLLPGILPAASNSEGIIMYLTPNTNPNLLLYGVTYGGNMSSYQSMFKGNSWESGENPFNIPNFPINKNGYSGDFKQGLLAHFSNIHHQETDFQGLKDFNFDATINIQAESGIAKVRAIKLPDMMPYNAVELFEPARLAN
ncbi:MAG: hypothetical protein V4722_22475, partial [Bacteroidota bacterium]